MPTTSKSEPLLVKWYGRSRLYDTAHACYVSIDRLREWANQGVAFSIIDTETGADVTRVLLSP